VRHGRPARPYGLYAYVVLSLLVGVRTEEARALRWDRVDLEGDPDADPPVPPHVDVWRSVRAHGDTKTSLHRWSKPPRRSSRDPSRVAAARPLADSPRAFSPPHAGQPSGSSRIRRRCNAYPWWPGKHRLLGRYRRDRMTCSARNGRCPGRPSLAPIAAAVCASLQARPNHAAR
jgi:hypothetical protein